MKKILLSLLIFCSVISQAQIQIPQVVGLPSALNSKVDKVTGKSLVADTSIVKLTGVQAEAQVNKIDGIQKNGIDLTITGKKVNVTVPTTAAEIGAQPAGTYATGTGTAYNSNTGDETLTSIKTKLGAATLASDGYLKYQDWSAFYAKQNSLAFGNLTTSTNGVSVTNGAGAIIGAGTAINITTASASSGGLLSTTDWNNFNNKQPSGSYEPAITKNTAFNKNFGTTTGTVLEGRTFGTAANSAVGDFQPAITGLTTNYIPKWNGSSMVNSLISDDGSAITLTGGLRVGNSYAIPSSGNINVESAIRIGSTADYLYISNNTINPTSGLITIGGNLTASSFNGNGSNLTGIQLPITLTTNGTSGVATFSGNVLNVPNYGSSGVNQTQTTVNGSTSGNMVCSMPFQTGSYKKVIIYLTNLVGTAEYIFPVKFVGGASKRIITTNVTVGTSGSFPDDRVNITATSGNGTITIEGY